MTKSDWELRIKGQFFETGKKLNVTGFDELKVYYARTGRCDATGDRQWELGTMNTAWASLLRCIRLQRSGNGESGHSSVGKGRRDHRHGADFDFEGFQVVRESSLPTYRSKQPLFVTAGSM